MDVVQRVESAIQICLRDAAGAVRFNLTESELRAALPDQDSLIWVDILGNDRVQGEAVLRDIFGFHPLTIDDCYNTLIDPPKVDDHGGYLFVIIHSVKYDGNIRDLTVQELNFYIGQNYVVSFHQAPASAAEDVRRRIHAGLILDRGATFLAHALIDVAVDEFQPVVEELDEHIADLEERLVDRPERPVLEDVLHTKRQVQRLRRTILPLRDVMTRFSHGEFPAILPDPTLIYFRDIYDHTVRIEEMIAGLQDVADSALNIYLSAVNNRLNEVMRTLAVVTVVFLPLTLVTGIYGTNFEYLPELGWRYGYHAMLFGMFMVAIALALVFRRRRWF